jgi:hypothetical protein
VRQGTVTVNWPGGSQSIAVMEGCDITQTKNLPAEGQSFLIEAQACNLSTSSASVDVPWISLANPQGAPHDPLFGIEVVVAVNTGPERIGHVITPIGQITIIQSAGNCVTAIAPTSQAFDESGGVGSISVTTAVPGCSWDATSRGILLLTPFTLHGTGSGVVQFTLGANSGPFPNAGSYLFGGSLTFQITQSKCPLTVSPLSFHVPAAAADYVVAVRVTGAVSCFWIAASNASNFIVIGDAGKTIRGSGDVRLSVTQNQTGLVRTGSAAVAEQTVVVTQDP